MTRNRKNSCVPFEISPTFFVDREEIMKLTKMAKSWEFTCSFCFKQFPSAQAMGGHQNAHRNERLEEKRLYVKDPISYRKRAFLQAMKAEQLHGGPPQKMVKNEVDDTAFLQGGFGEFNDIGGPASSSSSHGSGVMNFLPPKELLLAEGVGAKDHAAVGDDDAKDKAIVDQASFGINLDQKLDLTLKL